jgi:hypothetical protein
LVGFDQADPLGELGVRWIGGTPDEADDASPVPG